MRPIKFRAWDKDRNTWLNETDIYRQVKNQARWNPEVGEYYPIMQFAGLHDKNGKEVWEGDIVDHIIIGGNVYGSGEVIFDEGAFSLKLYGDTGYVPALYETDPRYLEVIGNIYENPELVEGV